MGNSNIGDGSTEDTARSTDGSSSVGSGNETQTPTPINLTDDTLVSYEGAKEPIKFSTLRGLQSQYTKVSQNHAKLTEAYKAAEQKLAEREAYIQRIQAAAGGKGEGEGSDFVSQLGSLDYLSGKDAVGLVREFQNAIQTRDQLLVAMAHKLKEVEQRFGPVYEEHSTSAFDRKVEGWRRALDLPDDPATTSFIRTHYLSYEPSEGLDEAFPGLLKKAWEDQERLIRSIDTKRREAAKRKAFVMPGRGGDAQAGKPLDLAGKTPGEITDLMWPLVDDSNG